MNKSESKPKEDKAPSKPKTDSLKAAREAKAAKKAAPKADEPVTETAVEIVPKEKPSLAVKNADILSQISREVKRNLRTINRTEQDLLFMRIKQGVCFIAAKKLVNHGEFTPWCESEFGDTVKERSIRMTMKLAEAFVKSAQTLALPPPAQIATYVSEADADDNSPLRVALAAFAGDMEYTEVLAYHGIRSKADKPDIFDPDAMDVAGFRTAHPEGTEADPKEWDKDTRAEFADWIAKTQNKDATQSRAMAAKGWWFKFREALTDKYHVSPTWQLLSPEDLAETVNMLKDAVKVMAAGLKAKG